MAKPEWGTKRTCQSCGARFYDLMRSPVVCPKCSAPVEQEIAYKPRRQAAAVAEPKVIPAVVDAEALDLEVVGEDAEVLEDAEGKIEGGDDDESGLIEDASDLGEDDDDMAEVMEHLDEDLENEI